MNVVSDELITEFVNEIRKYFSSLYLVGKYPCHGVVFDNNFPLILKNEWKEVEVEFVKERIEYYRYLNRKRDEGCFYA